MNTYIIEKIFFISSASKLLLHTESNLIFNLLMIPWWLDFVEEKFIRGIALVFEIVKNVLNQLDIDADQICFI